MVLTGRELREQGPRLVAAMVRLFAPSLAPLQHFCHPSFSHSLLLSIAWLSQYVFLFLIKVLLVEGLVHSLEAVMPGFEYLFVSAFTSHTTLGKILNFSGPQFYHRRREIYLLSE